MAILNQFGREVAADLATENESRRRNGHPTRPAGFIDRQVQGFRDSTEDPFFDIDGAPPNLGRFVIPHVQTFQGLFGSYSRAYRPNDEAIKDSLENARYMRNDPGIMESVECRNRATALLDWQLVPEDEESQDQNALCDELEKIIRRIRRFTEYQMCLGHAQWYGRYGIQHRWGWKTIGGRQRVMPAPKHENPGWLPINGDKLVFRYDDGRVYQPGHGAISYADQVGILVGPKYASHGRIGERWTVEPTGRGLAYFLTEWERQLLAIHKHMVEDGAWEDALDSGAIHGVGIRSRIYWDWMQKQEIMAFLISYLERSAGGIEVWTYPMGNDDALAKAKEAARTRLADGRNVLFFPRPMGDDGMLYDVQFVEPGIAGIDVLQNLVHDYFGHRAKRYILGQTLTSEADATGLGSGLAELHLDTFLQIVKYDSTNLEETITHELVEKIKNWNFPQAKNIHVRFVTNTETPDIEKQLQAYRMAWDMGASLKERDVMELIGASIPQEGDKVLQKPDESQMGGMPGSGGASSGTNGAPRKPIDPRQLGEQMKDDVLRRMFGDSNDIGDKDIHHVNEGGKWVERNVPGKEFDTGERRKVFA